MIAPPENFCLFSSNIEKLKKYKQWGLASPKATGLRQLTYSGRYTPSPTVCDVVGYVDYNTVVISINDNLHCIHPDYLAEMQVGRAIIDERIDELTTAISIETVKLNLSTKSDLIKFKNYVVLDFETTGFPPNGEIIEIGCLEIVDGIIDSSFSTLVKPRKKISSKITKLTGITNEMVMDAPVIEDAILDLYSFISNLPIVADNAYFDVTFLTMAYEKCRMKQKNKILDHYKLKKKLSPDLKNHKLDTIITCFDLSECQSHRALDDAICTFQHFNNCIQRLLTLK